MVFPTSPPRSADDDPGIRGSVLIVDDNPAFRRLARELLAAADLAVVGEAGSVADALAAARDLKPAGALVDIDLPDGNGFELAARLIALPSRPRVVITSVQTDGGVPSAVRRCGAEAFVLKADLPRAPLAQWLSAE